MRLEYKARTMAQLSSKQIITFSIDGILSSGNEEENLRRSSVDYREDIIKTETFPSAEKSTVHVEINAVRTNNNSPDYKLDKHCGEYENFVFVGYIFSEGSMYFRIVSWKSHNVQVLNTLLKIQEREALVASQRFKAMRSKIQDRRLLFSLWCCNFLP